MKIFLPIILFTICSCTEIKKQSGRQLNEINILQIESVELNKNEGNNIPLRLNEKQIQKFVNVVNKTSGAELRKAFPKYWINVKFKNGTIKKYKVLDAFIGEGDLYIKTELAGYFNELYESNVKSLD